MSEYNRIIILKIAGDSREEILEQTRRLMTSELLAKMDVTLGQIKQAETVTKS